MSETYACLVLPDEAYSVETEDVSLPSQIRDKAIIIFGFSLNLPYAGKGKKGSWGGDDSAEFKDLKKKLKADMETNQKKTTEELKKNIAELKEKIDAGTGKGKGDKKGGAAALNTFHLNIGSSSKDYTGEKSQQSLLAVLEDIAEESKEKKNGDSEENASVEIEKDFDTVTPYFHRLYMRYNRARNKDVAPAIKRIEVWFFHRRAPDPSKPSDVQTLPFSAYFFYDCKITENSVASDDDDVPSENITISFTKLSIHNWNTTHETPLVPRLTSIDFDFDATATTPFADYKKPRLT
jgi:hypothetical protein